ncbi:MAG: AmmeMemoRadiSam system protein A [Burkholderiales bacterium]|nr:AmmeMemoRadiSam system protein A [Burkholderiales bacterium]
MSPNPIIMPAASGYVVLEAHEQRLPPDAGRVLLPLARAAIAARLGIAHGASENAPWLNEQGASFITVTGSGRLRGCIGTLRPHRALAADVRGNAVSAAFGDPRFAPLAAAEFGTISLEVSVLSALEPLSFSDEDDALRQLRPGVDGVVLEYGHHSSTYLPQVWESIREPAEFLASLKYKAGLPPDFWDRGVRIARYTVAKWRETGS